MYKKQHLRAPFFFTFNIYSFQHIAINLQKKEHWQQLRQILGDLASDNLYKISICSVQVQMKFSAQFKKINGWNKSEKCFLSCVEMCLDKQTQLQLPVTTRISRRSYQYLSPF